MKRYLETLHTKPDHHKKRFALVISALITALIFSLWSLSTFGPGGFLSKTADDRGAQTARKEVSPFQSLTSAVSASFDQIFGNVDKLKEGVRQVDLESDYSDMKNSVLEVYGQ